MDEIAKQIAALADADTPPPGGTRFAGAGAGGGLLTPGKITANRNKDLQPERVNSQNARDRISISISELELLRTDLDDLISDLIAIRERL